MAICPCGCQRLVKPGKTYAGAGCSGRVIFRRPEALTGNWQRRAGKISGQRARARLEATVAGLTKVEAFQVGRKTGYELAWKKWKRWADTYLQQQIRSKHDWDRTKHEGETV